MAIKTRDHSTQYIKYAVVSAHPAPRPPVTVMSSDKYKNKCDGPKHNTYIIYK